MLKRAKFVLIVVVLFPLRSLVQAQGGICAANQTPQLRVVVAAAEASSNSVIAVPPATSWSGTIDLKGKPTETRDDSRDLPAWVQQQRAHNGLKAADLKPWHLVIEYDQFDEDGDNVDSGSVEQLWAGPRKYRVSYKSHNFNQTDYATDHGLFRFGDQRWPDGAQTQALSEVVDPFSYAASLQDFHPRKVQRRFGTHYLDCFVLERRSERIESGPTEYCFDQNGSAIRYVRGAYWFQTTYNDIISFQGRNIAREVEVTDGGKLHLRLYVELLETISKLEEVEFSPPADAINLQGKRLSGVTVKALKHGFPAWPDSLADKHFFVTVQIVIGKDGHVMSAHAVSGLPAAYKLAEDAAQTWTFEPYLVLGEPVEVETQIVMSSN